MEFVNTILAANENLLVYRGDSLTVVVNLFEDEEGTIPYNDLANWTELKLVVRENKDSIHEIVVLELGSGLTVAANVLTMTFTSEQMDLLEPQYYYDVQGTAGALVGTVLKGLIANENDVTR